MTHIYKILLLLLTAFSTYAQKSISAKIIDSISQQPIPYATISVNNNSGVISNNNGEFSMYLTNYITETDTLQIQSLGYETKKILVKHFTNNIVVLKSKSIELKEVLITNKNYSIDEIIEKIKQNRTNNYDYSFVKSKLFYRASYFSKLLKNVVTIKKSTIPEFNQKFIDSVLIAIPKSADDYTEILADLYGKTNGENLQKIDILKASHLYDKSKEISIEGFEEKFNTIIRKHVKRDSYFKIKSGLFGTKEDIDSTFFENSSAQDVEQTEAMLEKKKKEEQEQKNNFAKYRKSSILDLQQNSFIFDDSDMNFLDKSNRYDFKIEDYTFLNDDFVYKISFSPKRKEDFKGVIYVTTDNFAIVRLDYYNVKDLKNFKLLGISYNQYLKKGTLIYAKNNIGKYALKYADMEEGNKFGIKRPITIIEKNKHTKGRRKQNQLSADIHFIIANRKKAELVVFENIPITETVFNDFKENPKVNPVYLPKYDPEFWKGFNVIEPNKAIKDFKSIEQN